MRVIFMGTPDFAVPSLENSWPAATKFAQCILSPTNRKGVAINFKRLL